MKCPFCQGVIDDDSRYCDLCGKHLMFCPECRQPKKGTSCPRCGELLVSAAVTDVMQRVRRQPLLEIGVVGACDAAAKLLESHDLVEKVEIRGNRLLATLREGTQDYSPLPTLLVEAGFKLTAFKEDEINLETAFMALTKGITA